jgi:hypothetical protein
MCWNASVSLNTYALGLFASLLSYYNGFGDIYSVMLYQSFIVMQLIEFFIWSKTFSNQLLSQIALLVIILQPIFNIIKIQQSPEVIPYILGAYILFIIILYTLIIPLNTVNFSSVPSNNGHLSWKWLNWNIYIIFIWYAFLSIRWIIDKLYPILILVTALLIITLILYKDSNTFGSMWCWVVNILSVYLIFEVFYKDFCKI